MCKTLDGTQIGLFHVRSSLELQDYLGRYLLQFVQMGAYSSRE